MIGYAWSRDLDLRVCGDIEVFVSRLIKYYLIDLK
jgi:hypothetical protein